MEANYFIILWWFLPYINMNQPQMYMCPPSQTSSPPASASHPSGSSQCSSCECPVSCIKLGLVTYLMYGNIHVSMLFSQIIPPLVSPTESESLFVSILCLFCCLTHSRGYHLSKFHIYMLIYYIHGFLSDLLHSV